MGLSIINSVSILRGKDGEAHTPFDPLEITNQIY
jgi:hypothetical protein